MGSIVNLDKRLEKEFETIQQDERGADEADASAVLVDGDIRHWLGRIKGPVGTPYEGGIFYLDIVVPGDYPFAPPKIKFETPVWHPNISSQTGAICLDILKSEWSPALTIRTALISIGALLSSPCPEDPQDAEVATMYKRSLEEFNVKASQWVHQYASRREWPYQAKIQTLMEMGVDKEKAKSLLMSHQWDVNQAANAFFADS